MNNTIDRIESAILDCLELAENIFNIKVDIPEMDYTLRGMTNGLLQYSQHIGETTGKVYKCMNFKIRWNVEVAQHNLDSFVTETVPHEIAHYIDVLIRKTSKHDKHWRRICLMLGGSGTTCTSYDRSMLENRGKVRQQKRWAYECDCMTHNISTVRHNRVQRGTQEYTCRHCNQIIKYKGE